MHIHPELVMTWASEDLVNLESDRVERRIKAAMIVRIRNHSMDSDDHSSFPPDVLWCPGVPHGIFLLDLHSVAHMESVISVSHAVCSFYETRRKPDGHALFLPLLYAGRDAMLLPRQ